MQAWGGIGSVPPAPSVVRGSGTERTRSVLSNLERFLLSRVLGEELGEAFRKEYGEIDNERGYCRERVIFLHPGFFIRTIPEGGTTREILHAERLQMLPTRHVGNGLSEVLTHVLGIRVLTDAPFLGRARFERVKAAFEAVGHPGTTCQIVDRCVDRKTDKDSMIGTQKGSMDTFRGPIKFIEAPGHTVSRILAWAR
ncbi:hypothetical protein V8E55_002972 [Tylopilus felleus]